MHGSGYRRIGGKADAADGSILAPEVLRSTSQGGAMKYVVRTGILIATLAGPVMPILAQSNSAPAGGTVIGSVTLTKRVLADGQPLAPGTYQVRLSVEQPKPVVGQSPEAERYVEFVRAGKVAGREMATVISNVDLATMGPSGKRPTDGSRVDTLRGEDYLRVWINRGGNNYLIHLPPAA